MIKKVFDFGFTPFTQKNIEYKDIKFGGRRKDHTIIWTIFIYLLFSLGIFFRRTVNYPFPEENLNYEAFDVGIVAASFIIGLALLAPLLRIISKFHDGKLSWQHCLTAFTIGFFGDLTFTFLTNEIVNKLKGLT